MSVPWSTGFEDGFCDYTNVAGFCYGDEEYTLATEPRRAGGNLVAEFRSIGKDQHQTRCVRRGGLPTAAYYGAWYYIPESPTAVGLWNLFHFDGGDEPGPGLPALWDVTLVNDDLPPGQWQLIVFDPKTTGSNTHRSADPRPIPIGQWFHIELFLKRAADDSGEIALYQDGVQLFDQKNLRSDASKFTEWYVGNLYENATPADASLYVDDVSISATLSPVTASP